MHMKKTFFIALGIMALVMGSSLSGYAAGHGHGGGGWHGGGWRGGHGWHGGIGVSIWPAWDPWWWGYPYYPYYPYNPYYPAPYTVAPQEPEEYIQQDQPQSTEPVYWYFCKDPEGYYPYIKKCPKGWLRVVPPSVPPDEKK